MTVEGAPLRKVPFTEDYWHVVSDEHASIVGSLLFTQGKEWRAEFTGTIQTGWPTLKVDYFQTEEQAMQFFRDALAQEAPNE